MSETYDGVNPSSNRNYIKVSDASLGGLDYSLREYTRRLYYLTEGTHMLYLYVSADAPCVLTVLYVAESVEKFEFYEDGTKNLLVGYNADIFEEHNYFYCDLYEI